MTFTSLSTIRAYWPSERASGTRMPRLWFTGLVCLALALSTLIAPPSSSAATYYSSTVEGGVSLRPCVNTSDSTCKPVATTPQGGARMACWRDGSWANGNYSSNRWFLIEASNQQEGFVHSSFVARQIKVPNCRELPRVKAADWALGQDGKVYAPSAYSQGALGGLDWAPGPNREWSGDCAKLPYIAYKATGAAYPLNHAIGQWNHYKSKGLTRTSTLPRYGDPVFYAIGKYGHTGLYVGGKKIVATQGSDFDYKTVRIYNMYDNGYGTYLGWAKATA